MDEVTELINWLMPRWVMLPPAEAQRAWLDEILSLAIKAGMVDAAAKE